MTEPLTLETERLMMRQLTLDDVDALSEVLSDPWTLRFYHHPFSRDEVVEWIERWQQSYRDNRFGLWGLVLKETGELIGDTGLTWQGVDGQRFVEVGWHVHRAHQRKGYATEAGRASLDYGFGTIGLQQIISLIRPENEPSWRVAEKLGMRIWKDTMRSRFPHRVYLLRREEWVPSTGSEV